MDELAAQYRLIEARRALREARERHEWKSALAFQSREHAADAEQARLAVLTAKEAVEDLQLALMRRK